VVQVQEWLLLCGREVRRGCVEYRSTGGWLGFSQRVMSIIIKFLKEFEIEGQTASIGYIRVLV
jgi:hypothetical protein